MYKPDVGLSEELKTVERFLRDFLAAEGNASQISDILQDIALSGGKRLRPQLLLLAAQYGPHYEERRERLCSLAALIEMVHAASLVHDDIVDDSPLRRGKPSIQSKYGKDRAVYAGDLLLSRIVKQLFKGRFYEVGERFGRAVEEMCLGELGQMRHLFDADMTVEQYLRNVDGKTAALCRLACASGAIESGAGPETVALLETFGEKFGMMFQIRDDLIDFVSDASAEGKPVRMDFREGILTLPVLYAIASGPETGGKIRSLLEGAYRGCFGEAESETLGRIVRESGGLEKAQRDLHRYAEEALSALDKLPACRAGVVLAGVVRRLL